MSDPWRIHDLRDRPERFDRVAEAIWQAFWQHKGSALADIAQGLKLHMAPGPLPFTLLAEAAADGGDFLGTVSLIGCDEPERSDLAPWLAALWVEPAARRAGLGAALVREIERRAATLGVAHLYLSALPRVQRFYESRGWEAIDTDIGPAKLVILHRVIGG
jgi:GNAT superfamily N-acetyltransferase